MEQLTLNLAEVKQEIKERLEQTADNFVFIGYRLRQVLDAGAYAQEGYSDIYAFARAEFSLEKSVVSRFMAINQKYSIGGYGPELRDEFRGYGSSKLSEMLSLTDAECGMFTKDTTVKQIREYKDFKKDEPKEEIEGQQSFAGRVYPARYNLFQLLRDYFSKRMDLLRKILFNNLPVRDMYEEMNLTGTGTYKHKFVFLMMHGLEEGVSYKVFGRPQPVKMTWEELHSLTRELLMPEYEDMAAEEAAAIAEEKRQQEEREERERAEKEKEREAKENAQKEKENAKRTKENAQKPERNARKTEEKAREEETEAGKKAAVPVTAGPHAVREEEKKKEPEPQLEGQMDISDYAGVVQNEPVPAAEEIQPAAGQDQCDVATIHELKEEPEYFEMVLCGIKKFEIRKNDRDYKVGDILRLREWAHDYTGREIDKEVIYIFQRPGYGLEDGYCIMNW